MYEALGAAVPTGAADVLPCVVAVSAVLVSISAEPPRCQGIDIGEGQRSGIRWTSHQETPNKEQPPPWPVLNLLRPGICASPGRCVDRAGCRTWAVSW